MLYVKRNDAGDIVATFANAQVEEQEALAEDHAEVLAFRARLERRPSDPFRELRDEVSWLMSQSAPEAAPEPEPPLLPAPDALMSDWGPVGAGYDDVTGDMLLDAFEQDEAEAVAVIQVLSATRQRHISEQLNVEKARLRREHMLTDQANPREASIDRLLGLLTRRGD